MSKPKKVKKRKKKDPYAVPTVGTGPSKPTTLWDADGLHIWANFDEERNLVISGQDLNPPAPFGDEYEYALTVQREDIDKVVEALGGVRGEGVMRLLEAHGPEIKSKGEQAWLESIGVTPKLWSWY